MDVVDVVEDVDVVSTESVLVDESSIACAAGTESSATTTRLSAMIRRGSFIGVEANASPVGVWVNARNRLLSCDIKAFGQGVPCKNCTFNANGELHHTLKCLEVTKWNRCVGLVAFFN